MESTQLTDLLSWVVPAVVFFGLPVPPREQDYAEETAAAIDDEVRLLVQHAMDCALAILREKRGILERSARRLLEEETLDEKELAELIGPPAGPPLKAAAE